MTVLSEFVDVLLDAHMPIAQIMMIESAKPDPDIERVRDALNNAFARLEPQFGDDLRLATAVLADDPGGDAREHPPRAELRVRGL